MLPNEVNNLLCQVSRLLAIANVAIFRRFCHWWDIRLTWKTSWVQFRPSWHAQEKMYCLQWLIPVLLIPKPVNPALLQTHVMFMALYLIGFFLERKPCTICSLVFLAAVFLICYSGIGNCLLWSTNCDTVRCDNG